MRCYKPIFFTFLIISASFGMSNIVFLVSLFAAAIYIWLIIVFSFGSKFWRFCFNKPLPVFYALFLCLFLCFFHFFRPFCPPIVYACYFLAHMQPFICECESALVQCPHNINNLAQKGSNRFRRMRIIITSNF